ncbi:metal-sensitive transcriptional regulator [Asticcacaulis tiandongensis]|uniref:metal-sensitive transcriptional regulator n=1 Tax=Asticcacaulis tiandongensis TaxID=2565365 RepID=UPI00112C2506|nr:metal-sensitive transcriptional regulator [Asticcacaulis tiandongensis]
MAAHPSHKSQLSRLNRASGQIDGIKRMIEEDRYCVDILTQLKAVRSALKTIELSVLETHMHACLKQSGHDDAQRDQKIEEILSLLRKYE